MRQERSARFRKGAPYVQELLLERYADTLGRLRALEWASNALLLAAVTILLIADRLSIISISFVTLISILFIYQWSVQRRVLQRFCDSLEENISEEDDAEWRDLYIRVSHSWWEPPRLIHELGSFRYILLGAALMYRIFENSGILHLGFLK